MRAYAASWDDPVSAPSRLTTAMRTTALALWALARAGANQPLGDNAVRWLMNERREGRWASTQESAFGVLAQGEVARLRGEGAAAYAYRVTLNDSVLRDNRVERAGDAPADSLVIREGLRAGDNRLTREPANATGRLYYQRSYRYSIPAAGIDALDWGMAVARELLSADGEDRRLTRVKAGDLVKVRVTVLASSSMNYVAVEDYLPAGLEPVDLSLRTTSGEIADKAREEAVRQARLRGASCRIAWRYCYSPFSHAEPRDDRVALFAYTMPQGAHEYVYFARATTPGSYRMRPSRAAEVYFPDLWGRTDTGALVVEP